MVRIDFESCNGCGLCEKKCMFGAIVMHDKRPNIEANCILCGVCAASCPKQAIALDVKADTTADDFSDYAGVWVILQMDRTSCRLKKVSYELLSEARKLADKLRKKVSAVCLCESESERMREMMERTGCDQLLLLENRLLAQYDTDLYTGIVSGLILQHKPEIVLFPATEEGRDLAPRVASRLRVGLTADCTALEINEEGRLVQIRPTFGGNILASILTPYHRPQMASVRPNVFKVEHVKESRPVEAINLRYKLNAGAIRVKRLGVQKKKTVYKDVSEAEIIIAGGSGIGAEGFELLHELAVKTGAAVGASRKAVDDGWAPYELQIGQTGKTVAPELYIACGISGALQHSIGIKNAKRIIAINTNPTAPIFSMSDVAILGDARKVLAKLNSMADRVNGSGVFSAL